MTPKLNLFQAGDTNVRRLGYTDPSVMLDSDCTTTVSVGHAPPGVEPNLVCSDIGDGMHLPCLDIDFAARLVPSSTPGHFHLYLDGMAPLTWPQYDKLLAALTEAGIISEGYYNHSQDRQMTCLRRPGVTK